MSLYKKICLESSSGNILIDKIEKNASLTVNEIHLEKFLDLYTKELKDRIKELEKLVKCTEECVGNKQQEYILTIEQLTRQLAERESRLKNFVEQYQDKDLSHLPESYQTVFELFVQGECETALALLDEEILRENEKNQAENRILKGNILLSLDRIKEAEANFKKAVEIYPSVENYQSCGNFYGHIRQAKKAIACFKKAIKQNDDMLMGMVLLHGLGSFYLLLEDKHNADRYYQQAWNLMIQLSDKQGSTPYSATLGLLCDMAWLAFENKDYTQAEDKYRNALEVQRKVLEDGQKNFPYNQLADTLQCLARVLAAKQEESEAGELFLEAIDIWEKHVDENPDLFYPQFADALKYYADLLSEKDVSKAESYYLRALSIFRNRVSKYQIVFEPIMSQILLSLSMFYLSTGREPEAVEYLKEGAEIIERLASGGSNFYLYKLCYIYFQLGMNAKEREVSKKYFAKCAIAFGRKTDDSFLALGAVANYNLAVSYGLDQIQKYARYLEEAIRIQRRVIEEKLDAEEWQKLAEWLDSMEGYCSYIGDMEKACAYRDESERIVMALAAVSE